MRGQRLALRVANHLPSGIAGRLAPSSRLTRFARPLANYVLADEQAPVRVRQGPVAGSWIVVSLRREKFLWTGLWEPKVQEHLVKTLRPGMCFVDVGAHAGFFTILASRLVGDSGVVHAIEPMPDNCRRLEYAIARNRLTNVVVHRFAVAAARGRATLFAHRNSTMWSLYPDGTSGAGAEVDVWPLDDLVAEGIVPRPDLVKVDVEGAERDFLRGAAHVLADGTDVLIEFPITDIGADLLPHGCLSRRIDERHFMLGLRTEEHP